MQVAEQLAVKRCQGGTAGAQVFEASKLVDADGTTMRTITADDEGDYSFGALAPGTYGVVAEADGYARTRHADLAVADDTIDQNFVMLAEGAIMGAVELEAGGPANEDLTVTARATNTDT